MVIRTVLLLFMIVASFRMSLFASIYCPPDKTINCNDDRFYIPFTGSPTVFGYPPQMVRYQDTDFLNNCNVGYVQRRWYVDVNQDGVWQSNEGSCIQTIYIQAINQPISVFFPADRSYSCKEEIKIEKPSWVSGPCDVMGFSYKDDVFEVAADACYKIVRNFTVINWCTYHPQSPGWNGQGIWTHKQIIKVVESEAPVFNSCDPVIFNTESDCKAEIVLKKSALDNAQCPSQLLSWIAEVDLWANGTVDYKYGFNETGQFLIAPVANGAEISIKLPERVAIGKHKIKWSVRDQCGNFRSCISTFEVKDLKAPTPYMYAFLTSAFRADQMDLMVPARIFNKASLDNCTPKSKLRYSFSKDINDTLRVVGCDNPGFQFFTIYVTDQDGNSDFAEVFMLVFDNGSCSFGFDFEGRVFKADGRPIRSALVNLMQNGSVVTTVQTGDDGTFHLADVALMEDYYFEIQNNNMVKPEINILDFLHLKDYLFGIRPLENFQFIAADINQDRRIRANDLHILRDILLGKISDTGYWQYYADAGILSTANDLQKLRAKTMLMDCDGKFDFTAVYPGDITGAIESQTELRSELLFIVERSGDSYNFLSDLPLKLRGIQLEFNLSSENDNPEIELAGMVLNPRQFHFDKEKEKLRILVAEPLEFATQYPFLKFRNIGSSLALSSEGTNMAIAENGMIYRIKVSDSKNPNPDVIAPYYAGNGIIKIIDPDVSVKSVYRLDGSKVHFVANDGYITIQSPATGIYIIHSVKKGQNHTSKIFIP